MKKLLTVAALLLTGLTAHADVNIQKRLVKMKFDGGCEMLTAFSEWEQMTFKTTELHDKLKSYELARLDLDKEKHNAWCTQFSNENVKIIYNLNEMTQNGDDMSLLTSMFTGATIGGYCGMFTVLSNVLTTLEEEEKAYRYLHSEAIKNGFEHTEQLINACKGYINTYEQNYAAVVN